MIFIFKYIYIYVYVLSVKFELNIIKCIIKLIRKIQFQNLSRSIINRNIKKQMRQLNRYGQTTEYKKIYSIIQKVKYGEFFG